MLMPGLALACAIVLLLQHRARLFPVIAVAASGLELLLSFGIVRISAAGSLIALILAGALAAAGIAVYVKASAKSVVSAATIVTLVGMMQLASALHLHIL